MKWVEGVSSTAVISALSIACSPAHSQELSENVEPGSSLEEIVVTAQKRLEPLQEAPVSVTAITSKAIEDRGIVDIGTLSSMAPNLTISQQGASTATATVAIRGVTESEPILTLDSPNAVYLDGVVIARSTGLIFDMTDLERIEVLRGPQGTLYGRNTTGGAVNLITERPADKFEIRQMFSYGRFDYAQSRTTLNTGELGDSGIRFKFNYTHKRRDGYVDNLAAPDNADPGAYNVDAFKVAMSFDQGGAFRAFYTYDLNDRKSFSIGAQLLAANTTYQALLDASPVLGGRSAVVSLDRQGTSYINPDNALHDRVMGHNLTLDIDLDDHTLLRTITGYRSWTNNLGLSDTLTGNSGLVGYTVDPAILAPPYSFIPTGIQEISIYRASANRQQSQFTQELNLIGTVGDSLDYVLGAFYFREQAHEEIQATLTLAVPANISPGVSAVAVQIPVNNDYRHVSKSQAVFGQATYKITDRLSVTGGLRYTWDQKRLDETVPVVKQDDASFRQLTWMANLKYDFSNDIHGYGRVASGYKSGGFNPRGSGGAFDPEKIVSYEAGLKSELFNRRVRVNLAGFYTQYKDLQISQFESGTGGFSSTVVNAGKATYAGVEAEMIASVTKGLTLSGNIGYVDRKYKEYLFRDPLSDAVINVADQAQFVYSASTTAAAGMEYRFPPVGIGELVARLDYNYRSRVYFHQLDINAPFNRQISSGPVSTIDARLSLSDIALPGGTATFALWGRNITNRQYRVSAVDFGSIGFAAGIYAEPVTWGADLSMRF